MDKPNSTGTGLGAKTNKQTNKKHDGDFPIQRPCS